MRGVLTIFFLTRSFGWVNASYVYGLTIINAHMRRALGACTTYDTFVRATEALGLDLSEVGVSSSK